jgi:hypothetical protein
MNDAESIRIIETMQKTMIHIKHEHLVDYLAVAVDEETPNIKFLVVEEYLNENSISLRNLLDRIGNNTLL